MHSIGILIREHLVPPVWDSGDSVVKGAIGDKGAKQELPFPIYYNTFFQDHLDLTWWSSHADPAALSNMNIEPKFYVDSLAVVEVPSDFDAGCTW